MKRVLLLATLCILTASCVDAQTSAIASAGTGLISQLSKGLAISPTQAKGGAATLFSLAKSRLTADEFSKVSSAVPNMGTLLKAAPPLTHQSEFSSLESELPGSMGSMGRMAEAAEAFHKLGLSPDMAVKFLPIMSKYVESRGGADTAGLLEKALK